MRNYIFATIAALSVLATCTTAAEETPPDRRLASFDECTHGWVGDWGGGKSGYAYCCCKSKKDDCEKSDWKGGGDETCDSCSKRCEPDDKCYDCKGMEGKYWGPYKNKDGKCEKKWCDKGDSCIHKKVISNYYCGGDDDDDDGNKKDCGHKEEDCCDCCDDKCDDENSTSDFKRCVRKKCKTKCRYAAECYYDKKSRYKKYAVKKCR